MRVVCLGDSNTYGYDPRSFLGGRYPPQSRWVDLLAELTGWEIVNRGENGREIPERSHGFTLDQEADLLIVMLGTNDLLQGRNADETAEKMERFLSCLSISRDHILLLVPPPVKWGAWVTEKRMLDESLRLGGRYQRAAEGMGICCLDTREWEISLTFDGVHFDEDGHRRFAQELYQVLTSGKNQR